MPLSQKNKQELLWYPMRVTYQRELFIRQKLIENDVECFLPMRYSTADDDGGRTLVPALHNLLFVHSSQARITELKMSRSVLEPLRYMTRVNTQDGTRTIITVPDKQMDDFIRVATAAEENVMFLDQSEFLNRESVHVRIIGGPFAGVEGVVKRIKKNKRVVVSITDIAAVAITYVPTRWLEIIS